MQVSSVNLRKYALTVGIIAAVAFLLLASGCTQQTVTPPVTPTAQGTAAPSATETAMAGMANPASVYCGQTGGTTKILKDTTGAEYGMCAFPNGTSCEEWALYRGEGCKPGVTAPATATGTPAAGKEMVTFTQSDTTGTVTQGTKFAVTLSENPTTGYQWNATVTKGLAILSSDYQENTHAAGMVGVGGVRTWVIQANDLGNQGFSAVYKRSWETTTGNETAYSLTVTVVKP